MKLNEQETNEVINLLEQFNHCYGKDETGLSGMEIVEPVTPVTVSMINSLDDLLERLKSKTV